jgi:iron complex outermembrane receptor protein
MRTYSPSARLIRKRFRHSGVVAATLAGALAFPQVAFADDAAAEEAAAEAEQFTSSADAIVVTGTRATGRTVAEAVAPIDVVSGAEIELANKANLLEQLQANLPSFFVQNSPTPNVGSMVRAGELRGQNAGHTLVLINGKRRHSTAFLGAGGQSATAPVDLSTISSSSIQRVEVLRDGASAIYGSDAIAGVINIITDHSESGGSASARYGQQFKGDGETFVAQLSQGFAIGDGGHLRLSGQYDEQKIVIRNGPVNPALLYYFPINPDTGLEILPSGSLESNPQLPAGAIPNPKEATRDNNAWINSGKTPFRLLSFVADFSHPIGNAELYALGTFAQRDASAPQNFRTPNRDANVRAIYPDGYTPVEEIDESDYSILAGFRGDNLFGFEWDASTVYGKNSIDIHVTNSLNATYGLDSPTEFYIGNHTYSAWTSNFDIRRSFDLGGIPVDVSLGLEHRREHYQLGAGDEEGYTHGGARVLDGPNAGKALPNSFAVSQALPAYRPDEEQDVHRNSTSGYIGVSLKPVPQWTVDLALRGEHYSDFGDKATWRASTRFDFIPEFAIRGTIATGFHAPALAALSHRSVGNMNTTTNYTLAVNSAEAIALGARPLQPETSRNYSAGIVARPAWGLNLAVDVFQIDVRNRITALGRVNTGARWLDNPALGTPAPGQSVSQILTNGLINPNDGISYLINSSDIRTRGLEVTADKTFDLGPNSTLRIGYAGAFIDRELKKIYPAPTILTNYNPNIDLLSAGDAVNLENTLPKVRHIFTAGLNAGRLSVFARQSYWGTLPRSGTTPVTSPNPGTEIFYDLGALWTTDLSVSYRLNDKLSVSVAGNNIFEAKPERTPAELQGFTQLWSYGNNGAIGAEGGFWSIKLDAKW